MPSVYDQKLRPRGITTYVDGTPVHSTSQNVLESELYKVWTTTPNYRNLIKSGTVLPENPFTYEKYVSVGGSVITSRNVPQGGGLPDVNYSTKASWGYNFNSTLEPMPLSVQNAAIFRALSRARQRSANLPLFIKEANSSARMIHQRASQLVDVTMSFKRGNFILGYQTLFGRAPSRFKTQKFNREFGRDGRKASANALLETQYGWLPLIGDIRSATLSIMDLMESDDVRKVYSSSGSSNTEVWTEIPNVVYYSANSGADRAAADWITRRRYSSRVTFKWVPAQGHWPARFGLTNVPLFLYDTVALSFVLNWIIPIQSYLEQFDNAMSFTFRSGSIGQRREVQDITSNPRGVGCRVYAAGGVSSRVAITRTPLASEPVVGLRDLRLDVNLGFSQAASMLALLQQRWPR